ncbi:MAG: NUDIX hydrolase [Patescibacteria group bacterium]
MLVKTFTETGFKPFPSPHISDDAYAQCLQSAAIGAADVIPIDRKNRTIYLAWRRRKPAQGWWFFGGRVKASETNASAAIRCFARETKVSLGLDRITHIAVLDYLWKDRAQEPCDMGCHTIGHTFVVELSSDELVVLRHELEPGEYDYEKGIRAFNREELVFENVLPPVIELYDEIFKQQ